MVAYASVQLLSDLGTCGPAKAGAWAELWQGSSRVCSADLVSGSRTDDRSQVFRGSCSVVLVPLDGLVPEVAFVGTDRRMGDGLMGDGIMGDYRHREMRGLLLPLKTQIRLFWRGQWTTGATWETLEMGRYTVQDVSFLDEPGGPSIAVTGLDASSDIAASPWGSTPLVIARGTNAATALTAMLYNRAPTLTVSIPATSHTTPRLVFAAGYSQGGTPWDDCQKLAAACGWVLYINRLGQVVAEDAPDPTAGSSVWGLSDTVNAISFRQVPSAANTCNQVVVYAENSGETPVSATVTNTAGPYGTTALGRTIGREYRSPFIKTYAQAAAAGVKLLRQWGTLTETVEVETFPAPHLDASDVVSVTSEHLELDDVTYGVDSVVFDFGPNNATRVTCSRRI